MNDKLSQFLNEGDLLFSSTEYELYKGDERLFIRVGELIGEGKENRCLAVPHVFIREAQKEFIGRGNSIDSALMDCLSKIKNLSFDVIFPSASSEKDKD